MIVNLEPIKFKDVAAGDFSSDIPIEAKSTHSQGRIVGIHVVSDEDVKCDIFFCRKKVDISLDTLDQTNIFSWVSFKTNIECPAGLYHMGDELKISYDTEGLLGDFYLLLKNTGAKKSSFSVYLTISV